MKKQKSSYAKILLAALSAILIYTLVTLLWTQKIETTISSSAIKSDQEYKVKQILFDLDGLEPILVGEQMIKSNQDGSLITSLALPGFSIGQQYLVRTCVATSGYQYDDSLICEGQGVGLEDNLDQYLLNICSEAVPIKGQGFMSPSRLVAKKQNQSIDQCSGLFAGESNPSLAIENGQLIDRLSGKSYGLENLLLTRVDQNTSLVDNQDGTYTFRGSDGEEVLINTSNSETVANLALSGNTLSYTNELGQIVGIDLTGLSTDTLTYISVDSSSQLIFYTNEADITTQIDIRSLETTTSLQVDISSQIIRYINEEGAVVTVDMTSLETISTLVDNNNGTYTYTNEDGASLTFENTLNTLNCTDGQSVAWNATTLEWECAALVGLDVLTMIGVSGSTLSYVDELGNTTNIDIKDLESTSTLVNNNNGTYTYTNEDGATATITDTLATLLCTDNQVASWDNTNSVWVCADASALETLTYLSLSVDGYTLEYQDENGSTTQINLETIIDNFETLTALSVNSLAGTLNYTDENGTANTIDLKPLIAANETLTTLTVSGSTITYTDEDGGTTDIDIKDLETLTTVAQSGQGSFTYTDEAGTTHTINTTDLINSSGDITITGSGTTADPYIVSFTETHTSFTGLSGTGKVIGTYTNENGDTFDLRETVTNLAINTTNQTITYTNENGTQVVADIKLLESTSTLVNNNNGTYTYTNEDGATATITDTLATLLCTDNQVASWDNTNSVWVCADGSTTPSVNQVYLASDLNPDIGGVPQDDPDDPAKAAMAYSDNSEMFFSWNVTTQSWDIVEQISPNGLVCSIYDFISQPTWGSGEPSANRLFHDYLYNPTTRSYLLWSNDDQLYKEAPLPSYGTFNIAAIDDPSAEFTNHSLIAGAMEPAWYYTQGVTSFQQSRPSSTDTFNIGESYIWSASNLTHMVGVTGSTTNDIAYTNALMDFVFYPNLATSSTVYTPAIGTAANGNTGTLTVSGQTNTVMARTNQDAFTVPTGSVWKIKRTGDLSYEIYEDGVKIVDVVTTIGGTKYITQGANVNVNYYTVEQNMEGYYGYGSDSHKEFLPGANTYTLEGALANGYFVANHEADQKASSTWDITDNYIQETGGSSGWSTYLSQIYLDVGDKFVYSLDGNNDTYVGLGNTQIPIIDYTDIYNQYGSIRYYPALPAIYFNNSVVLNPAGQGGGGYIYEIERVADDIIVMRVYDKNDPTFVLVESQKVSTKADLDRARIGFSTSVDNAKIVPVEIPVIANLQVDGTFLGDDGQSYTESEILAGSNVECLLAGVGGGGADSDWLKTDGSVATDVNDNIYTLGNVGIGTNAPSVALEIDSNMANQSGLKLAQLTRDSTVVDWYSQPIGVDIAGNVVRVQPEVLQVVDSIGVTYISPNNVMSFDSVLSGTTWITGGWTSNRVVTIPAGMNVTLDAEVVFGLTPAQTGTIRYAWREVGTSNYFGTDGIQTVTSKTKGARYVHLAETVSKQYELVIIDFGGALSVQSVQDSSEILVQEF